MEQAKIDRINELAALKKQRPLTEAEAAEQAELRAAYLAEFRARMRGTLDRTVIERPDGSRERVEDRKKK